MKIFWKEQVFGNMFVVYHFGSAQYITQNKKPDTLRSVCVRELRKNKNIYIRELRGRYFAFVHSTILNQLKHLAKHNNIKYQEFKSFKRNISRLNARLLRDSKCSICPDKKCRIRESFKITDGERDGYVVIFKV